jgi:predicted O-methyltransferase YrrM
MSVSRRGLMAAAAALPIVASPLAISTPSRAQMGRRQPPPETMPPPLARDDFERNAFKVLADIHQNQQYLNVSRDDGRMLRIFTELANAKKAVELGTSTGYSAIWIALALRRTGGRLTTFEIDGKRAAMAAANFKRAGVDGLIEIVVGDAHKEAAKVDGPLDFAFSDADKEGYLTYFKDLAPKLRTGGVYISDNMAIPAPDPAYVRAITTDPNYETVFFNMHRTGTAVTYKLG